jgi:hypothetical protein
LLLLLVSWAKEGKDTSFSAVAKSLPNTSQKPEKCSLLTDKRYLFQPEEKIVIKVYKV